MKPTIFLFSFCLLLSCRHSGSKPLPAYHQNLSNHQIQMLDVVKTDYFFLDSSVLYLRVYPDCLASMKTLRNGHLSIEHRAKMSKGCELLMTSLGDLTIDRADRSYGGLVENHVCKLCITYDGGKVVTITDHGLHGNTTLINVYEQLKQLVDSAEWVL